MYIIDIVSKKMISADERRHPYLLFHRNLIFIFVFYILNIL